MAKNANQHFADPLDCVRDSLIVHDREGVISTWNKASESLYGWSRQDAVGKRLHDLVGADYSAPWARIEQVLADQGRWSGEVERRAVSGERVVARVLISRRDTGAQGTEFVEAGQDITAARQAETAAQWSEYRYRAMFKAMQVAFWEVNFAQAGQMMRAAIAHEGPDLRGYVERHPEFVRQTMEAAIVIDLNDEALRLYGIANKADAVGKSIAPYWPVASEAVYAESLFASLDADRPVVISETRHHRLDGGPIDVLHAVFLSPEGRRRATTFVASIDITERKTAEAELRLSEMHYRTMFETISVSFWALDFRALNRRLDRLRNEGVTDLVDHARNHAGFVDEAMNLVRIVDVNDKTVRTFGGKTRADILGPLARFWPESTRHVFVQSLNAGFNHRPSFEAETQLATLDGRLIDVIFTACAPPDSAITGNIVVGIADISEQVAARTALQRLQNDLAHASRVSILGELTASIAHEINQPLAAIITNGEAGLRWLNRDIPDIAETTTLIARTIADADRAAGIVSRIRAMASRHDAPKIDVSMNALIEEAMAFLHHEFVAQNVALKLDLAAGLPDVRADRTQIQQVLVNLAVNGMQAMAQAGTGQRRLAIRSFAGVTPAIQHVCVEDNGPGFGGGDPARLFESFHTTKAGGLGLGLSICRSIIESHGGRIAVENAGSPGGAHICFTLGI